MKKEKTYCVYMHTNKLNGKKYIGQTRQPLNQRWREGKGYKRANSHFFNAIQKYGWGNFKHEVLAEGLTCDEANELEIKFIAEYNTTNKEYGYNAEIGGKNSPCSEETRQLISLNHANMKGKNNPRYGVKLSDETKKKIGDANRGTKRTEEYKEKLRQMNKGEGNPFYGKKHTDETKEKIRQQMLSPDNKFNKRVRCIETGIVYYSAAEAARQMGTLRARISECARGVRKSYKGYHWEYID